MLNFGLELHDTFRFLNQARIYFANQNRSLPNTNPWKAAVTLSFVFCIGMKGWIKVNNINTLLLIEHLKM